MENNVLAIIGWCLAGLAFIMWLGMKIHRALYLKKARNNPATPPYGTPGTRLYALLTLAVALGALVCCIIGTFKQY